MTNGMALVDGLAIPIEVPAISVADMGFLHGDTHFTTMAVHAGRPVFWEAHVDRLEGSARACGYPPFPGRKILYSECLDTIRIQRESPSALRLTLSRGRASSPGIDGISTTPVRVILPLFRPSRSESELREGATAETFLLPWDPAADSRFSHKTGNLLWVKGIRALKGDRESVEQILVNGRGEILEGTISSVFAVDAEGVLRTAPISAGILPGIMRAEVLEWARKTGRPVREEAPRMNETGSFREIFLTSATLPILPLHTLVGSSGSIVLSRDFPVALSFLKHYWDRLAEGRF